MTALVKVLSESFFNTSFPASITGGGGRGGKVASFSEQNSQRVLSVVSGSLLNPLMMVEQVCCRTSWTKTSLVLPFCTHFKGPLLTHILILVQKEN